MLNNPSQLKVEQINRSGRSVTLLLVNLDDNCVDQIQKGISLIFERFISEDFRLMVTDHEPVVFKVIPVASISHYVFTVSFPPNMKFAQKDFITAISNSGIR